ncbi:MAG: hypothetical protein IIA61_11195 [Candidatus Marinimicrobia bacterium]|nr:hypothetical protein [Candidatus Neomarinimicrobiota bacterium]
MEFNPWILLFLLLYVIVAYLRKKRRAPSDDAVQRGRRKKIVEESEVEELMPDWFKEIILPKEPTETEAPVEMEEIPIYEAEKPMEPIKHEGPTDEETLSPLRSVFDKKLEGAVPSQKERVQEYKKELTVGLTRRDLATRLTSSEGLKEIILLREILGPPRALKRYNRRDFN